MSADYSGTSVPTLNNSPASSWTTDAAKKSHVNDLYLVTGSGTSAGNLYAFEEYAKPLVKNATPGEIVTFTDGGDNAPITSASVALSPIQDLNGFDSPWPGGGGKNLFGGEYNVNFPLFIAAGTTVTAYSDVASSINYYKSDGTTRIDYWSVSSYGRTFTLSEDAYYFRFSGASSTPTKMYVAKGSSFSGFAPYSNICPISGHTGAELYRTGKNLIGTKIYDSSAVGGVNLKTDGSGTHYLTGTSTTGGWFNMMQIRKALILPPGTYTISASYEGTVPTVSGNLFVIGVETQRGTTFWGYLNLTNSVKSLQRTFVLAETTTLVEGFWLAAGTYNAKVMLQVELGSTATSYEPYQGDTYSVTFPETIYGGSHDFVSGKAVSNMVTITLGGVAFTKYSVAQGNLFRSPALPNCGLVYDSLNVLCSAYPTKKASARTDISISCGSDGKVDIIDNRYSDADSFNAAMSGVQLVYELATPLEYTLSPKQLTTLQGQNNVWSDAGEITQLTYTSNQFTPSFDWFETWTVPKITRDNGQVIVLPKPQEYTPEIYDVDAATTGRNAAGAMIRDRVARKHKFNYKFAALSQQDATEILNAVQDVSFTLTIASPETGAKTNYRVYVGDRSMPIYWMPTHAKASWMYSSLSLNLIEM